MQNMDLIVLPIKESMEPALRYGLQKSNFRRIGENIPTDKNDLQIVRRTLPPNQRRISAEDLFLRKDIYEHTPTETEIGLLDYETLPEIPVQHHDPVITIDAEAPRQAKVMLAKALLSCIDVGMTEQTVGVLENRYKADTILSHALDACTVIERIYRNLLGRNLEIDQRVYWAKILAKIAYALPRLANDVRLDMLGEIIENTEDVPSQRSGQEVMVS